MLTIKLVVIGNSGVGKTSLRGQYISGRFSTGYRATIGADFITKTLPHPTNPQETVTLQIWDTAGQERFSSLSSAFFRGADAALLMYDVNQRSSLDALHRWWDEFCANAPLDEDDMEDFCCVIVGNKMDLISAEHGPTQAGEEPRRQVVSEKDAMEFMEELVPRSHDSEQSLESSVPQTPYHPEPHISFATSDSDDDSTSLPNGPAFPDPHSAAASESITIVPHHHSKRSSRTHSVHSHHSAVHPGTIGTIATTRTGLTSYHTPSSSYFDVFESARSSPVPHSRSHSVSSYASMRSRSRSTPRPPADFVLDGDAFGSLRRRRSTSSLSSLSAYAPTITPSLFTQRTARPKHRAASSSSPPTPRSKSHPRSRSHSPSPVSPSSTYRPTISPATPLPPDRGPRHFSTSAKTGEGVADVFKYICARVVKRWEWEEARQARLLQFGEANRPVSAFGERGRGMVRAGFGSAIRLKLGIDEPRDGGSGGWRTGCCSS